MGLKIFMAKKDHEEDLVDEMRMRGYDPVPFKYGARRRLRKANKWVLVQRWAIKGMVFCDCDPHGFEYARSVWCRDDKYVEIREEEISHLLSDIVLPQRRGVPRQAGDTYIIPSGPFIGCTMTIETISHTRYRGFIEMGSGVSVPIDVPRD